MFAEQIKLPPAVCWGGGGGGATGLLNEGTGPCLVAKQAVEFPQVYTSLHNITLSRRTTTVRSNDTLGNTPFQLISDFFHVNQSV